MKQDLLQQTIRSQKIASDPRNSAWVFASAGSGKTKVLIDRLLRLLLGGASGGNILCVTFTKVAALEMQDRVNNVLQLWMMMDDEQLKATIFELTGEATPASKIQLAKSLYLKLMDDENAIKIVTIHSLCQDILKIFPFEVGISPNFEVMDAAREKIILNQAKGEVFNLCSNDKFLEEIVTKINGEISQDEFLKLLGKFLANKEKILSLKRKFFDIDNVVNYLYKAMAIKREEKDENFLQRLKDEIDFTRISELLQQIQSEVKRTKMDEQFLAVFEGFRELSDDEAIKKIENLFFKKDGKKKAKILSKKFEDWSDFAFDLQEKCEDFFDILNSYGVISSTELILRFVDKILVKYQEIKSRSQLLDYNDLIVKVNQLLSDEKYMQWVRYRLDGFYDHVLIDESQDTNSEQWQVIEAICSDFFTGDSAKDGDRTIFVIGDDKQSIFGFQGANPNISSEKYEYYRNLSDNSTRRIEKLSLHNSFRSLPQILDFVDNIFASNSSFIKSEYQNHNSIRQADGLVEIWPHFNHDKKEEKKCLDFLTPFTTDADFKEEDKDKVDLANHIANNILEWRSSKREIAKRDVKDSHLAIEYKDIMVVLRNQTNGFSDILKNIFTKNKIPFKGASKLKFRDHLLLLDLMGIAKFSLLPIDDLNLSSLLKSTFFKASEEFLLKICNVKNKKSTSIFQALEEGAAIFAHKNKIDLDGEFFTNNLDQEDDFSSLDLRFVYDIYCKLAKIIKLSKSFDPFEFFVNVLNGEVMQNIYNEFGAVADDVIDEFLIILSNIDAQNDITMQYFVDFVEKTDPEIKLEQSDENSVTITTIHSAKGLQSPIVIVPDCCFSFNKMPSVTDNIIWMKREDENYGEFELPIWLARKKYSSKILDKELEYRKIRLKEEYLRLFYVALTRAENELYISGFGKDNDPDSWYNLADFGNFGVI